MPTHHLRLLTERRAPVPEALLARAGAWRRAADEAAAALTEALGTEVAAAAPTLSLTDSGALEGTASGVLCPLGDARGHLQVAAEDALRMAALLLRSEDAPGAPVLLDALLIRAVARAVLAPVADAFDAALTLAESQPLLDWPLREGACPVLRASLPFEIGAQVATVTLLLDAPHTDFAARIAPPVPSPALRRAALAAPARLDAVLDRWSVSPGTAAALTVGTVLPLPGASVEALELRVRTRTGSHVVGEGELGRARGRQAVRVTRVA